MGRGSLAKARRLGAGGWGWEGKPPQSHAGAEVMGPGRVVVGAVRVGAQPGGGVGRGHGLGH